MSTAIPDQINFVNRLSKLEERVTLFFFERADEKKEHREFLNSMSASRRELYEKIDGTSKSVLHLELKLMKTMSDLKDDLTEQIGQLKANISTAKGEAKEQISNNQNQNMKSILDWVFKIIAGIILGYIATKI